MQRITGCGNPMAVSSPSPVDGSTNDHDPWNTNSFHLSLSKYLHTYKQRKVLQKSSNEIQNVLSSA